MLKQPTTISKLAPEDIFQNTTRGEIAHNIPQEESYDMSHHQRKFRTHPTTSGKLAQSQHHRSHGIRRNY